MRIDKYLTEKFSSRTKAAEAIEKGLVLVNGTVKPPSYELKPDDIVTFVEPKESFVSNGGYKLSKALKDFGVSVAGMTFADIGASNGGFTDCLFKNGAKKVYCIDVGESQLDSSLLTKNVVIMDNFNARNLTKNDFNEVPQGIVIDVSFISLTYILKNAADVLDDGFIIALIKPQFECECKNVGKNGIVKDAATHKKVVKKIYDYALSCNLAPKALTQAPERKGKNVEYLILLEKNGKNPVSLDDLNKCVKF